MIMDIESPIGSTKKLHDLINEFGKVEGLQSQYSEIDGILIHQ